MDRLLNSTVRFTKANAQDNIKYILRYVVRALKEQGYNPVDQLVGYVTSGDPTYITNHAGARNMIHSIDRFVLLEHVLSTYIDQMQAGRVACDV